MLTSKSRTSRSATAHLCHRGLDRILHKKEVNSRKEIKRGSPGKPSLALLEFSTTKERENCLMLILTAQ
jgi:hypothetical protein